MNKAATELEIPHIIKKLQPWVQRVKENTDVENVDIESVEHFKYNTKLHKQYVGTKMTEEEHRLFGKLYLSVLPMLKQIVGRLSVREVEKEDILSSCFERTRFILLTYDPDKGSTFNSWLHRYIKKDITDQLETPNASYNDDIQSDPLFESSVKEEQLITLAKSIDAEEEMKSLIKFSKNYDN